MPSLRTDLLDALLLETVHQIAVEHFMRVLVAVGVLSQREGQSLAFLCREEGDVHSLGRECIDRPHEGLKARAWPIVDAPVAVQVAP